MDCSKSPHIVKMLFLVDVFRFEIVERMEIAFGRLKWVLYSSSVSQPHTSEQMKNITAHLDLFVVEPLEVGLDGLVIEGWSDRTCR